MTGWLYRDERGDVVGHDTWRVEAKLHGKAPV